MADKPKAMVSSMASIHAEREVIADDLRQVFENVVQAPERSVAGSRADDYLENASTSHFMVVLLGQESRDAVIQEIEHAHRAGCHVAAFALHYPPYLDSGASWSATPEEKRVRDMGVFVKSVSSISELRVEVKASLAQYVAISANRFKMKDFRQNYATANDWLNLGAIRRVALVQKTSMFVLGPRKGEMDERTAFNRFVQICDAAKKAQGPEFVHIFDKDATLREARDNGAMYDLNAGNIKRCQSILRSRAQRIHFAGVDGAPMASVLLVNDHVGMSVPLAAGGTRVVLVDDRQSATGVMENIKHNAKGNFDNAYLAEIEDAMRLR